MTDHIRRQVMLMGPFHSFLRSGSRYSWVNFYTGQWEITTSKFILFPFAAIAKEKKKICDRVYTTFQKREKI